MPCAYHRKSMLRREWGGGPPLLPVPIGPTTPFYLPGARLAAGFDLSCAVTLSWMPSSLYTHRHAHTSHTLSGSPGEEAGKPSGPDRLYSLLARQPARRQAGADLPVSLCLPRPGTELMLFNAICQVKEGTVSEMLGTQLGVLEPPSHSLPGPGKRCVAAPLCQPTFLNRHEHNNRAQLM